MVDQPFDVSSAHHQKKLGRGSHVRSFTHHIHKLYSGLLHILGSSLSSLFLSVASTPLQLLAFRPVVWHDCYSLLAPLLVSTLAFLAWNHWKTIPELMQAAIFFYAFSDHCSSNTHTGQTLSSCSATNPVAVVIALSERLSSSHDYRRLYGVLVILSNFFHRLYCLLRNWRL